MADIYQKTDNRSEDTNPETPRLLAEGIIDIPIADYYSYSGGYITIYSLNISELNDLGNRVKGYTPQSLDIRAWKTSVSSPGGQINDTFYPLNFTRYSSFSTPTISEYALIDITNQYIIGHGLHVSLFDITHWNSTLPGRPQSFSYKIYSTIFEFTDTYS